MPDSTDSNQHATKNPTVLKMVLEAVDALGGSASKADVQRWVEQKYPGTNPGTISCQCAAGTVNAPARVNHYPNNRPRPANDPNRDLFFSPSKDLIERYDPNRHGYWEIYENDQGKCGVRQVAKSRADSQADVPILSSTRSAENLPAAQGGEVGWMNALRPRIETSLQSLSFQETRVRVRTGHRLPYAYEVMSYEANQPCERRTAGYQTDLLICDETDDSDLWYPRVVIECKVKGVTTHDALTYSQKAATHKNVHPYLRYGILVGSYGGTLPTRLVRHGAYFDFMTVWDQAEPSNTEWEHLIDVLVHEVRTSRSLHELLSGKRKSLRLLHRPLVFKYD